MSGFRLIDALEPRRFFSVTLPESTPDAPPSDLPPSDVGDDIFRATATAPLTPGVSLTKGALTVIGNTTDDTIAIAAEGTTKIAVTFNGTKTTYDRTAVRKLLVAAGSGNDKITLNLPAALAAKLPVKVTGDAGNDSITSNVAGAFDGGEGNDSITGSSGNDKIVGGVGDDTLISSGGKDSISGGAGLNRITYANGDRDLGAIKLRTDKRSVLIITGSKANDTFNFAKGSGNNVTLTIAGQTATFDTTLLRGLIINGGAGQDKVVLTNNPFANKIVIKHSIELP